MMLAYMNAESLRMTMELKPFTTPAAARKSGTRGATSSHVQKVKQILIDC